MKKQIRSIIAGSLVALALTCCSKPINKDLEDLILANTSKNQVIMVGEQHGEYKKDSDLVIKLLPQLKKQGFEYLALELYKDYSKSDMDSVFAYYTSGIITREDIDELGLTDFFAREAAGWLDIIDAAKKEGMQIVFYDASEDEYVTLNRRDKIAFENLKELIFDKDPDAKVIVYCGTKHINEKPVFETSLTSSIEKELTKFLGFYLNEYTKGKNLTISLCEYSLYKTPHCDLIIDLKKGEYHHK